MLGQQQRLETGEVGIPSFFLCLMILSCLFILTCGSHLFETSADLFLSSSTAPRVTRIPYSHLHTVSIIVCSPLDHEPWRDRTECLIPISLAQSRYAENVSR